MRPIRSIFNLVQHCIYPRPETALQNGFRLPDGICPHAVMLFPHRSRRDFTAAAPKFS
jgi:hypothetical protein